MCIVHCTSMTSSTIAVKDNTVKLGITLPKSIIQKIDQRRGDIARSRYIRRAIERYLGSSSKKGENKENERHREQHYAIVSTVGFGGIVGFLIGFTIKRIMKILAVIAGVFFAATLIQN